MIDQFLSSIDIVVEQYKRLKEELELAAKENVRLEDENNDLRKLNEFYRSQIEDVNIKKRNLMESPKNPGRLYISPLKEQIHPDVSTFKKKRKILEDENDTHIEENSDPLQEEVEEFIYSSPVGLISSPTKIKFSPIKQEKGSEVVKLRNSYDSSPSKVNNVFDSKSYRYISYNSQLPTQYSYESSSPTKSPTKIETNATKSYSKSPEEINNENKLEIIEDSEDELDKALIKSKFPLTNITNIADIPKSFTKLQRREYICNHLAREFSNNPIFAINLDQNPINESNWVLTDFKPNAHYVKPKVTRKLGYSLQQQKEIDAFYKTANANLIPSSQTVPINSSQLYDKFPSPPGFMVSDFPSTQEEATRRELIKKRQDDRLYRRVRSCLSVRDSTQIGEFVFFHEILNQYVLSGRYSISNTS